MVNAKANVTPEMLLWLAERMGLQATHLASCGAWYLTDNDHWLPFNPATDDAQFGRLVVWALQQSLTVDNFGDFVRIWQYAGDATQFWDVPCDFTPDSIRAAAVVAICRALGYEGEKE